MTLEAQLEAAAERGAARAVLAVIGSSGAGTQPLLHTIKSAASRLGVSAKRVRELVDAGELRPMPRETNQLVLIPDLELIRYASTPFERGDA